MAAPRVKVRVFHELRTRLGTGELELEADTLKDVVDCLMNRQESTREILYDGTGHLRNYTFFYVNNEVQNPPNLSRKLSDGDLVLLVPPAGGG